MSTTQGFGGPMSFLTARAYDLVMYGVEIRGLQARRAQLLKLARGRVLEIGSGTGANLASYGADLEELILLEPDPYMRPQLEARLRELTHLPARVLTEPAERLPLPDNSVDTAVATLVLCTVGDPAATLAELKRVLKPDGQLLFMEHVAAEGGSRRLVQDLFTPAWRFLASGCHLNRETESTIRAAGFEIQDIGYQEMAAAPGFVRPMIQGMAHPTPQ